MKNYNIDFGVLARETTFRSDINFLTNDILVSQDEYYCFDELFEIVYDDSVDIEQLSIFDYAEIGNVLPTGEVTPVILDINNQNEFNENYFKKIKKGDIIRVEENDILISKVRPYLKKIVLIDNSNRHIYFTSAFLHLRPRKCPRILFHLLRGYFINYINSVSRQGKGYPTLSDKDLRFLKFNKTVIDKVLGNEEMLLERIINIEKEIKDLQSKILPINLIIDKLFEKEYNIYREEIANAYEPLYLLDITRLSDSYDFRSSFRFHSRKYDYLKKDIFRIHTFDEVIDKELTTLGRQMSPDDILEDSDFYYINTNSIKITGFDESVMTPITETFYKSNCQLKVEKNDILLISSGEGSIGKATIFNSDKDCITSQFVMKLHPKVGTNIDYVLYYIQSFIFQNIVEKYKKGKGNMTNIFASQLIDFPILLPSEEKQNVIVHDIKSKIEDQNRYDMMIDSLRLKIDEIISSSIDLG